MSAHHLGGGQQPARRGAGLKRQADDHDHDELERQSGISTHFKKLRINNAHGLLPVQYSAQAVAPQVLHSHPSPAQPTQLTQLHPLQNGYQTPVPDLHTLQNGYPQPRQPSANRHEYTRPGPPPPSLEPSDFMPLDSTPYRLFIPNLAAEIAAIEADEQACQDPSSYYLPSDYTAQISKIPEHLLRPKLSSSLNNQLVLYRDPTSISVPESEDAVRKAIVEARKRTRERQAREREESSKMLELGVSRRSRGLGERPEVSQWHTPAETNGVGVDHAPNHYFMDDGEDDLDAMDLG